MEALKQFFGFSDEESVAQDSALLRKPLARQTTISEIKIETPQVYDDSTQLAAFLREGKPVIVNLSKLDPGIANRFVDFLCGTSYAINGHMFKLTDRLYLFTPAHVLIIESEGMSEFERGVVQERVSAAQYVPD